MSKLSFTLFLLTALLGLVACSDENEGNLNNPPNLRSLSVPEQELVQQSNHFAFAMFKEIASARADENLFISPAQHQHGAAHDR